MHTNEPLISEPSLSEVAINIWKSKRYKSSGIEQIPAENIQTRSKRLSSLIHTSIYSTWNKEELSQQWKERVIVSIYTMSIKLK